MQKGDFRITYRLLLATGIVLAFIALGGIAGAFMQPVAGRTLQAVISSVIFFAVPAVICILAFLKKRNDSGRKGLWLFLSGLCLSWTMPVFALSLQAPPVVSVMLFFPAVISIWFMLSGLYVRKHDRRISP